MKHLIIIGARGYGREVFGMAIKQNEYLEGEWDIKGFLDDKSDALDGYKSPIGKWPQILGSVEAYEVQKDDIFICALGNSFYRRKYAEIILSKGGEFISLISPLAIVSPAAEIGYGSIISAWCTISNNCKIGRCAIIHSFSAMGHDACIGDYVSLESYVFMGGYSEVGEESVMHVRSGIIPHKKIGARCSVGFGSVVMRNFKDDLHLFGNPARKIDF